MSYSFAQHLLFFLIVFIVFVACQENEDKEEASICGGFLEFDQSGADLKKKLDYSSITVQSFTLDMILKETSNLAASGYYFLPVYENEPFILKISGPFGMSFEPEQYVVRLEENKKVKDFCSSDINFKFRGFAVEGQVSTFGSNEGPEGINLALYNEKKEKIQTTVTLDNGMFKFKPLYPGSYVLKPVDDVDMFDKAHQEFNFEVKFKEQNFFPRALIIKGYKLSGLVLADRNSLEKAQVLIYSSNSTLVKNYDCKGANKANGNNGAFPLEEFSYKEMIPFCVEYTDAKGHFTFDNIPYGHFLIRPIYKNDYLMYHLTPDQIEIEIQHKDYVIKYPIQVMTFSIYGKVVNSKGTGIPNVTIKIDGQVKALTDQNGIYILEKMTPGNYDLEAQADDMFFEPLTNIRITAHLSHIQDLIVTDYKLCGKIIIEATDYFAISKRTVVLTEALSKKERRTITDQIGKYCFEVKPGTYQIAPVLTQDEKNSDLHLQPESYDLEVIDHPILDANFYQSKVVVSGKVTCLKQCGNDIKVNLVSLKNDKMISSKVNSASNGFEFTNILSGQYKLAIIKPEWCWDQEDIIIKVQNTGISNLEFKQIGYSMPYTTHHDLQVEWLNEDTKQKKTVLLEKTQKKICLASEGKHIITPQSCYKFTETSFVFDTFNTSTLDFIPSEYRVLGKVDIEKDIINKFSKANVTNFKITFVIDEIDNEKTNTRLPYKRIHVTLDDDYKSATTTTTNFHFYTKANKAFVISPVIQEEYANNKEYEHLIFSPKERRIEVNEECFEDRSNMAFALKAGLIIEGSVTPPLSGILISAYSKRDNSVIASTSTSKTGKYKIGPLYKDDQYDLKATKEGYKIVRNEKNQYDFNAEKLSFLRVKVVDTQGKPLTGVFLSLSSADRGFRINNNTNSEGYFDFIELYSGEYYIKPLYKEYQFDHQQKKIVIKGGEHYEEVLIGTRIAFSIFGKINHLNKEKVEGIYIQALNENTQQIQETAIDKNGEYRLKGLVPGERYQIKVKIPASSSIEKALPAFIPLTLGKEDITAVDFVVLQRAKRIDIRGYLNYTDEKYECPFEKMPNTYVELTKPDENDEVPIKVASMLNSCQFIFRNLDKVKYHMRVYEKPVTKGVQGPRMIIESTVDLGDERDINNGVKVVILQITKPQLANGDNLYYTIYSPLFLFGLIFSVLKWDYTVWLFNTFIASPIAIVKGLCDKKAVPNRKMR